MNGRRQLVINADDLGFVPSVTRGIIEAIETGIVTSASLMVNMDGTDDAVRGLAALRDRGVTASIGLHFNIVVGRPVASVPSVPSLVNARTGEFHPLTTHMWRAWRGALHLGDVEGELIAQLEKAEALLSPLGMRVTHIDSHQHSHCLSGVFDLVLRVAKARGITHVRHPNERAPTLLGRPHALIAVRVLRALVGDRVGIDDVAFTGIALMRSPTFDRDVVDLVKALPPGTTELMVHPGYDSPELAAIDRYRAPRERELRALTSPLLRERIRNLGVELTRFGATTPLA